MVLVGDIGGTNTTLALVRQDGGLFVLGERKRYSSSVLTGMEEGLNDFLGEFPEARNAEMCCLSAAGPVRGNRCTMTNVRWSIDGDEIAQLLSRRTFIINDFSAICYALPLADSHETISTVAFPHPDGSLPQSHGNVRAVVGAGTGLGTGYLTEDKGHFVAHPSEAGHSDFAPTDEEMRGLAAYLREKYAIPPGAEQFVSGQGILNAFNYMLASGRLEPDRRVRDIQLLTDPEKPGAIANAAETHEGLAGVMLLFVRMYARYASNITLCFLPRAGLYLAGGIAAKNQHWFTDNHYFMTHYETNYNPVITPLLRDTPVQLIKDYDVSLYGAAHAAVSLQ